MTPTPGDVADPEVGDRHGAFSGGLWSAVSTVAPMAGTLALSVVISRQLGADVLGEQSLVAYVASTMVSVLIYSFTVASVQLLASAGGTKDDGRLAWLERWSIGAHLAGGTVVAGIMVAVGLGRTQFKELWFLAAATAVSDALGWAHASRNIARRGWAPTSSRRLIAQAVSPLAGIAAIFAGSGVAGVFVAQLIVSLALQLALRRLDRTVHRPSTQNCSAPPWRPVLRLWGMFALSGLITEIVARRLELVFLDHFQDARTVAMYSVAFSLVTIPVTLSGSLIHAAMPAIAARHAQDPAIVVRALSRAARIVVAIDLVLAAGTVSVGPSLIRGVYGADFSQAATLARWLGLVLVIVPLGQLCNALWSGTGRLRPVLVSGGIGATLDVALAWLLIPSLAAAGAVIATVSAQSVAALVIIAYTLRSGIRFDLRLARLTAAAVSAAVAGAAAAAVAVALPGLLGALVSAGGFCAVIGLCARFVGLFAPDDLQWLEEMIPRTGARAFRALSPHRQ